MDSANFYYLVRIGALQIRYARLLQHYPIHAIPLLQTAKVLNPKSPPAAERLVLRKPLFRQWWKHADGASVRDPISHHATLGNGAKTIMVFSWDMHVVRVQGEDRVGWSVVSRPFKRLYPGIPCPRTRPFDVGAGWKKRSLSVKHSRAQGQKQKHPPPPAILQDVFSQQTSRKQNKQDVNKVKAAHKLQSRQAFEARRNRGK